MLYIWLHDSKLSTQDVLPMQKHALSAKIQTCMSRALKKKKKNSWKAALLINLFILETKKTKQKGSVVPFA